MDYRVLRSGMAQSACGGMQKCGLPARPASMSTPPQPPSPTPERSGSTPFWRLSLRTWLLIGAAFAIGLLLFLLLWSGKRDNDFFRVAPSASPGASETYEPLPAPLPADQDGRRATPADADAEPEETPKLVERTPPPPRPAPMPPSAPRGAGPTASGAAPVPVEMPAPRYPAQAARRGLGGTVRVRADVGSDGVPTAVAVVDSSGTRELDRAALDAVRRWRFRPGQVDGKPVPGSVVVPIEFALRR